MYVNVHFISNERNLYFERLTKQDRNIYIFEKKIIYFFKFHLTTKTISYNYLLIDKLHNNLLRTKKKQAKTLTVKANYYPHPT